MTMTTTTSDADERRINLAVTQLAAVEQLHHRQDEEALTWDCVDGACEHEEAARGDDCPTITIHVCAHCYGLAVEKIEENEGSVPDWAMWPCATAKAFGAVA